MKAVNGLIAAAMSALFCIAVYFVSMIWGGQFLGYAAAEAVSMSFSSYMTPALTLVLIAIIFFVIECGACILFEALNVRLSVIWEAIATLVLVALWIGLLRTSMEITSVPEDRYEMTMQYAIAAVPMALLMVFSLNLFGGGTKGIVAKVIAAIVGIILYVLLAYIFTIAFYWGIIGFAIAYAVSTFAVLITAAIMRIVPLVRKLNEE